MVNEYDDEPGLYLSKKVMKELMKSVKYNGKQYFPDENYHIGKKKLNQNIN